MTFRFVSLALAILLLTGVAASRAETPQSSIKFVTNWEHLLPPGLYDFIPEETMSYEEYMKPEFQEKLMAADRQVRPELDKKPVILPGYMVPIRYKGSDVFEFLLVPSAGQCIHVPPPPVNQTVFVKVKKPTRMRTYGEPVIVEGAIRTKSEITEYAETGYRIEAKEISDFDIDLLEERIEELGDD